MQRIIQFVLLLAVLLAALPARAANKIEFDAPEYSGSVLYLVIKQETTAYNGTSMVTYTTTRSTFAQNMTEQGGGTPNGIFLYTFPALPAGDYTWKIYRRAGGSPSHSDQAILSDGRFWNGTAFGADIRGVGGQVALHTSGILSVNPEMWNGHPIPNTNAEQQATNIGNYFANAGNVATAVLDDVFLIKNSVTSVAARLGVWTGTGRNTVLGAFQALFRKDADATVPSDVNANLGGGAGAAANNTDSLEAQQDTKLTLTTMNGDKELGEQWQEAGDAAEEIAQVVALVPIPEITPDPHRTWVMRRTGELVGATKKIAKKTTEAITLYAQVENLLGTNEAIGPLGDIVVTVGSGATITPDSIEKQGDFILFEVAGGTAGETTVEVSFDSSTGRPIACEAPLVITP